MENPEKNIGNFISEKAKTDFYQAYNEAISQLPKPNKINNIKTQYGIVSVYSFYKKENEHKEPLLLLPGRSASTPMWKPNLEGLMKERPVYTIDALGEPGMSEQTRRIENRFDQAKWLHEVLVHLKLEKVHLMGVSFGGWNAMNLALLHPQQIASISLLDPVFVFEPISFKMIAASIPASIPFVPKFIREKMLSYISGGAEVNDSDPIAKLIESGMSNYKVKLPIPAPFKDSELEDLDVPILAIMAGKSTMHNSEKAVKRGKKLVRNIQIEVWPDASHAINGEFPDEVNEKIISFIQNAA
ncbi:alpha/beta fold hydrolase [Shimazuella alba]|uniref:Alpha/beta fold hydrolase n=1 Tax=Shimazuella alba TaxID=2690964 RepID=A0A6I4VQ65_9BACL|nr:alpha/beta hydrolase [Shimazuella alba]MXQ53787.1 alpha/beta fold hydrolase [Shimazuella alba]